MKIYIIGKRGFEEALAHVKALGHEVMQSIMLCEAVYLLSDWKESEESCSQHDFAQKGGKIIFKQKNTGMSYFHDLQTYRWHIL